MPVYDVIKDFAPNESEETIDQVSVSPYAILAIWRFRYPATFSRAKSDSFTNNVLDAIELKPKVLIVTEDLRALDISDTKGSHISRMAAEIAPGTDYLSEAFPGDFCAGWMVNSIESLAKIIENLSRGTPANDFMSGLKFFGRVDSLRKSLVQNPGGIRSVSYSLTASGFTELDASIYYEPYLQATPAQPGTEFLQTMGLTINQLMEESEQGISINKIVPLFLQAFYGEGVPKDRNFNDSDGAPVTNGLDNPNSFIIPNAVAKILGTLSPTKSNGLFGWCDIMETVYGIQRYTGLAGARKNTLDANGAAQGGPQLFSPDGISTGSGERFRYTGIPMLGTYQPSPPQFTGQHTVWSILNQYLNPVVNEMFTGLRTNPQGRIMPTLVVRQLPFSTGLAAGTVEPRIPISIALEDIEAQEKASKKSAKESSKSKQPQTTQNTFDPLEPHPVNLTYYTELPRWRIHPILVRQLDVGRSDAVRQNFCHVYGDDGFESTNRTRQFVRNPPFQDSMDILRSGLRPTLATVSCGSQDILSNKATDWMYILSDITFGQHLTLNGTIACHGIQAPIAIGDNIEFDDTIFHIESVRHTFQMSQNGMKSFSTTLNLTRGMKLDQAGSGDLDIYTGINHGDLSSYDPGVTRETSLDFDLPLDIDEDRKLSRGNSVFDVASNPSGRSSK